MPSEKLAGVVGLPIPRGPGGGSGHPPSGPVRDTFVGKVRSNLEVSKERLCLPSQSSAGAAGCLGKGASLGPAGVAGAWGEEGVRFHPHNWNLITEDTDLVSGRDSLCAQL